MGPPIPEWKRGHSRLPGATRRRQSRQFSPGRSPRWRRFSDAGSAASEDQRLDLLESRFVPHRVIEGFYPGPEHSVGTLLERTLVPPEKLAAILPDSIYQHQNARRYVVLLLEFQKVLEDGGPLLSSFLPRRRPGRENQHGSAGGWLTALPFRSAVLPAARGRKMRLIFSRASSKPQANLITWIT